MKTTTFITTLLLLAGFSASAFGQGQVTLANNSSSLIRIGDPVNGAPIPVGSMLFQLYVGIVGTPEGSLTPLLPTASTSTTTDGRIRNTVIDVYPQFPVAYPGRVMSFQIWAWSSSFVTHQEAADGGGGWSENPFCSMPLQAQIAPMVPILRLSLAGIRPLL